MQKWGLQGANAVYSMYYENLDFVRWAKSKGCKSIVDVYVSPLTDEIMQNHQSCFDQDLGFYDPSSVKLKLEMWHEVAELADLLVCPSEWVAEGVRRLSPAHAHKTRIVPYGCSINYEGRVNQPIQGRVLFAGSDVIRKGIENLAEAATLLKSSNPEIEVRVAGTVPESVVKHPVSKDLVFLGRLEPTQMKEAFLDADVFVLPSLSEGYAGVVAEAVGAGCPVVVTKESGSLIRHECEGLITPSQNSQALAEALSRMVNDRELRARCADNCLKSLEVYTLETWKQGLTSAIGELFDTQ